MATAMSQPEIHRRPRWRRRLAIGLGAGVIILAAAPEIVERTALRNTLLRRIVGGPTLEVSSQSASLGWFSPVEYRGLRLAARERPSAIDVPRLSTERTLWQLAFNQRDIGLIEIDEPRVAIAKRTADEPLRDAIEALAQALRRPNVDPLTALPALHFRVKAAGLSIQAEAADGTWKLAPIDLIGGVERPTTRPRGRTLIVDRSKLADHARLQPSLCNDVLKFVAPILAEAAWAEGDFSLELDTVNLPLDDPSKGNCAGRLRVHAVAVGPGPLMQVLREVLRLPERIELADEAVVEFELRNERVYHRGLAFGPPVMRSEMSGSVGLDETLDLHVRMPIPAELLNAGRLRESLAGQEIPLHIVGTLRKPELDRQALVRDGLATLFDVLGEAVADHPVTIEQLERRLAQAGPMEELPSPEPDIAQPDETIVEKPDLDRLLHQAVPLVEELLAKRRQNRASAPMELRGRPLRRLLDSLVPAEAAEQAPPAARTVQ